MTIPDNSPAGPGETLPVVPLEYARPVPRPHYLGAVLRALGTVLLTALVFALGGGVIGLLLGWLVPDYYRGVFHVSAAESASFSPAAVGFGLGLSQGAALGAVCGVGLAFVLAWRETRPSAGRAPPPSGERSSVG